MIRLPRNILCFFLKKNKNWTDFVSCARARLVGNIEKFLEKSAIQTEISSIFCLQPCFGDFFTDFNRNLVKFLPLTFRPLFRIVGHRNPKFPWKKWKLSSLVQMDNLNPCYPPLKWEQRGTKFAIRIPLYLIRIRSGLSFVWNHWQHIIKSKSLYSDTKVWSKYIRNKTKNKW